jgi:hypothetical protein
MIVKEPRLRERFDPFPWKGSLVKLGTSFIEDGPMTNKWQRIADTNESPGFPFASGEVTRDELHGRPPYRIGGPFQSVKIENSLPKTGISGSFTLISNFDSHNWWPYHGRQKWVGGLTAPDPWFASVTGSNLSDSLFSQVLVPDVTSLGTQVWDRLKPRIEQAGLFVAIAEIRDIPHMLHGTAGFFHDIWLKMGGVAMSKVMTPKKVADHFLNHQFGWVPFINDIQQTLAGIVNYADRIDRLSRENGQWIKRRVTLVNSEEKKLIAKGTGSRCYPANTVFFDDFYQVDGTGHYIRPSWEIWEETTTFAQATGSFRYYLPEFDTKSEHYFSQLNQVRRMIDLFGLRVSPSNIYKAIPWTWLIDWVTSVGKSLQAIQDETLDNMAAKYMFLSHHKKTTTTFKQLLPFNSQSGGPQTLEFTQFVDVKQRKEASSPFGFDLDWSNLSPRQLSILAALGISRHK